MSSKNVHASSVVASVTQQSRQSFTHSSQFTVLDWVQKMPEGHMSSDATTAVTNTNCRRLCIVSHKDKTPANMNRFIKFFKGFLSKCAIYDNKYSHLPWNMLLVHFTPNAVHGPDPQPSVVLIDW